MLIENLIVHNCLLHSKFDIYVIIFNVTTVSSIVLQSLFSGLPVSVTHWSDGACDNFVISTLVSSLWPKSSVSIDGMVKRTSGNCVNLLLLSFSKVHRVSSPKLSGRAVSWLWDKSIAMKRH